MTTLVAQSTATAYPPGVPVGPVIPPGSGTPVADVGFGCCFGATGTLTIGATVMNCPAWDMPNLTRLWAEAEVRGDNQKLPTVAGMRGYPKRLDQAAFDLKLYVTGDVDPTGVATGDPWVGLEANLEALRLAVFDPVTVGRGVRSAWLTMPDATVRYAEVQVGPLTLSPETEDPSIVEAMVHLTVVTGRFV